MKHTISIDTCIKHQTFEGFGTSSCWWSQTIDSEQTAAQIAEYLYDDKTGLGLDIYRYNVGAGEKVNPDSRIGDINRRTESFYVYNVEKNEYEYDFTRDANARRMLDKAIDAGANEVILFCNSPHYSMTVSGHASGGFDEAQSNLPEENYAAFVNYLLTIADWFVEQGYPVVAISPINEPQWKWGGESVNQEGCHYTPDETAKVLEMFATEMQKRNSSYKLRGPENGQMSDNQLDYIKEFCSNKVLRKYCDTICGHAYWMDDEYDDKYKIGEYLKLRYPNMKYEMSEWCELPLTIDSTKIESGIKMANVIISDLNLMNAVSWQSWTAVNGDGVMDIVDGNLTLFYRYYAFKQFSAFIKSGMVRVSVNDNYLENSKLSSTAFTDGNTTVLVVVNNSESAEDIKIAEKYDEAQKYITDAQNKCEKVYVGKFQAEQQLPALSITTFIFNNHTGKN